MSTKFGIPIRHVDVELGDEDGIFDYIRPTFFEEVWFSANYDGQDRWLNSMAERLPDYTRVYALDNSQQGVYTIGDIKKIMEEQNK